MKYFIAIFFLLMITACTDRESEPIEPARYGELDLFLEEVDPEDAEVLYRQYMRERMELEQKFRDELTALKKLQSSGRVVQRNINKELESYGLITLPTLMDTLSKVDEEIKRQNRFVVDMSSTLSELQRDPNVDPSIVKAKNLVSNYTRSYEELYTILEDIYIAQKKLDLAPNKKDQAELNQQIKSAAFLASSVQQDIVDDLE
jgi:phage terminase Nu1 subunit (DNA packaging protein)